MGPLFAVLGVLSLFGWVDSKSFRMWGEQVQTLPQKFKWILGSMAFGALGILILRWKRPGQSSLHHKKRG